MLTPLVISFTKYNMIKPPQFGACELPAYAVDPRFVELAEGHAHLRGDLRADRRTGFWPCVVLTVA